MNENNFKNVTSLNIFSNFAIGMKKYLIIGIISSIFLINTILGQNITDGERLIRIEAKQDASEKRFDDFQKAQDKRFDDFQKAQDKRFDELREDINRQYDRTQVLILWIGGILFSMNFALLGYMIWDRQTAQKPMEERLKVVENKVDKQQQSLSLLK